MAHDDGTIQAEYLDGVDIETIEEILNDLDLPRFYQFAAALFGRPLLRLERSRLRDAFQTEDLEQVVAVLDGLLGK